MRTITSLARRGDANPWKNWGRRLGGKWGAKYTEAAAKSGRQNNIVRHSFVGARAYNQSCLMSQIEDSNVTPNPRNYSRKNMWLNPSLKWMKLSYFWLERRKIFDIIQLWSSATTSSCCWQLVAAAADLRNRSLLLRDLRNCSLSLRDRNKSSKPCDRFEVAPSTKIARWKFEKIGSSHQNGVDFFGQILRQKHGQEISECKSYVTRE